jgi:CO/xanthine dehydrogenase Mo-binding subunit
VTGADLAEAEASPGVLAVWTHFNCPKQAPQGHQGPSAQHRRLAPALEDERVGYFGQPVAFVVADTLENAAAAAHLVKPPLRRQTRPTWTSPRASATPASRRVSRTSEIGDFEAGFAAAEVRLGRDLVHADPEPLPDGALRLDRVVGGRQVRRPHLGADGEARPARPGRDARASTATPSTC